MDFLREGEGRGEMEGVGVR